MPVPAADQGLSSVISHVTLTILWGVGFIAPVTPEMIAQITELEVVGPEFKLSFDGKALSSPPVTTFQ